MPAWKLWLFRVLAAVGMPLLLLGGMELALRTVGYGYSTKYFRLSEDGKWYNPNADFGKTFFPSWFTDYPQPINFSFPAQKDEKTFRIFVQGASAAQGYPAPAFSFAHALQVMLQKQIPDVKFEVVNTGVVAINSHVVLPIAKECSQHEPDATVVYLGNNEVVGPYGAGTVLKGFSPNMGMIRAGIWSKSTRLGQLLSSFGEKKQENQRWGGMSMFKGNHVTADDARLDGVYKHFEANLQSICAVNGSGGVPVLLCTVAVNLRESAPFASEHGGDLSGSALKKWKTAYDQAIALQSNDDFDGAISRLEEAASLDEKFADLQFRLGQCHLEEGNASKAQEHFKLARKYDALRFRADEKINNTIRSVAEQESKSGVTLVDIEQAFASDSRSADQLPGNELFYEHVHMNIAGNHLIATELYKTLLPLVEKKFPQSVSENAKMPPTLDECKQLLAVTKRAEYLLMKELGELMKKPPFTDQLDAIDVASKLRTEINRLNEEQRIETPADEEAAYRLALEHSPDDIDIRFEHAVLQNRLKRWPGAIDNLKFVLDRCPSNLMARLRLCTALNGAEKFDEAIQQANELISRKSEFAGAYEKLADAHLGKNDPSKAIASLEEALKLQPERWRARVKLGSALTKQKNYLAAGKQLRGAIKQNPGSPDAYAAMGELFEAEGKQNEAINAYAQAIRINRFQLTANRRLAAIFTEKGNPAQAKLYQDVIDQYEQQQ